MSQLPNKGALPPLTPAPAGEAKSTIINGWGKFCPIVPVYLQSKGLNYTSTILPADPINASF